MKISNLHKKETSSILAKTFLKGTKKSFKKTDVIDFTYSFIHHWMVQDAWGRIT